MRTLLRGLAGALLILGVAALGTGPAGLTAQDKKKDPKSAVPAPPKKPEDKARDEAKEKTVGISTSDGLSLNAYWYQGVGVDKNPPDAVLMFPAPPNKVNDQWIGLAKSLSEKNFSVLLFDFRGLGMNSAETAGQRVLAEPERFWREPYNQRMLKGSQKTIEDKGLDYRNLVNKSQPPMHYRDMLFNDLLAARFYLDRQNDNKKCNSARIWVVTEKDGGQMALAFIASEFPRNSISDPDDNVAAFGKQFKSAGKDFVGLTCLSYATGNSSASAIYNNAFKAMAGTVQGREAREHLERRVAMFLVHGKKEGAGGSKSALSWAGAGGDAEELKRYYKYVREFDNSKAAKSVSGIDLIDPQDTLGVKADIVKAMQEISKVQPINKDPYDRNANKMTIIPRFRLEDLSRR